MYIHIPENVLEIMYRYDFEYFNWEYEDAAKTALEIMSKFSDGGFRAFWFAQAAICYKKLRNDCWPYAY